jgi:hypothetical protein
MSYPKRHRRHRAYRGRHNAPARHQGAAVALTACALAASATGILLQSIDPPAPQPDGAPQSAADVARAADLERDTDQRTSRDEDRAARRAPVPSQTTAPAAVPPPRPAPPAHPRPVAGLTQAQMDNAAIIVRVGQQRHLPRRAMVIAVATAMQESDLYNCASSAVPSSFRYPHQGSSVDSDSIGLFQQRPSMGWGTVAHLMDPAYASGLFYDALLRVRGWQTMRLTDAAQAVQRSAYPYAYQKHETRAQQIVAALLG